MGCGGSSEAGASKADDDGKGDKAVSKQEMLFHANARMSQASLENANKLFQQYRHRQSLIIAPELLGEAGGDASESFGRKSGMPEASRSTKMSKRDLRALLHDVDPQLFEFVWGLFDTKKVNAVYSDDFVAAMALLSRCGATDASFEEQIRACFIMFDTRDDGRLSYAEFRSMVEATVTLNLRRMLLTDTGLEHVGKHMEKEFSKENLTFWLAVREYRTSSAGQGESERTAAAKKIIEHYVKHDAEEEVNLPHTIKEAVMTSFQKSVDGSKPPETSLFNDAEEEIFKLMERDAYARFKANPESVSAVVDSFFDSADISHDGYISFTEYSRWVRQQPQVIVFFSQLAQSVSSLLKSAPQLETQIEQGDRERGVSIDIKLDINAGTAAVPGTGDTPMVTPEPSSVLASAGASPRAPAPAPA